MTIKFYREDKRWVFQYHKNEYWLGDVIDQLLNLFDSVEQTNKVYIKLKPTQSYWPLGCIVKREDEDFLWFGSDILLLFYSYNWERIGTFEPNINLIKKISLKIIEIW